MLSLRSKAAAVKSSRREMLAAVAAPLAGRLVGQRVSPCSDLLKSDLYRVVEYQYYANEFCPRGGLDVPPVPEIPSDLEYVEEVGCREAALLSVARHNEAVLADGLGDCFPWRFLLAISVVPIAKRSASQQSGNVWREQLFVDVDVEALVPSASEIASIA